jgi:hypothetical protein
MAEVPLHGTHNAAPNVGTTVAASRGIGALCVHRTWLPRRPDRPVGHHPSGRPGPGAAGTLREIPRMLTGRDHRIWRSLLPSRELQSRRGQSRRQRVRSVAPRWRRDPRSPQSVRPGRSPINGAERTRRRRGPSRGVGDLPRVAIRVDEDPRVAAPDGGRAGPARSWLPQLRLRQGSRRPPPEDATLWARVTPPQPPPSATALSSPPMPSGHPTWQGRGSRPVPPCGAPAQPVPGRTVEVTVEIRPSGHGRGPPRSLEKGL